MRKKTNKKGGWGEEWERREYDTDKGRKEGRLNRWKRGRGRQYQVGRSRKRGGELTDNMGGKIGGLQGKMRRMGKKQRPGKEGWEIKIVRVA